MLVLVKQFAEPVGARAGFFTDAPKIGGEMETIGSPGNDGMGPCLYLSLWLLERQLSWRYLPIKRATRSAGRGGERSFASMMARGNRAPIPALRQIGIGWLKATLMRHSGFALQMVRLARKRSFDHLVGAGEDRLRHGEAESLRSL